MQVLYRIRLKSVTSLKKEDGMVGDYVSKTEDGSLRCQRFIADMMSVMVVWMLELDFGFGFGFGCVCLAQDTISFVCLASVSVCAPPTA